MTCPIPRRRPLRVVGDVRRALVEQLTRYVSEHRITEHVVRDALAAGYPLEDAVNMDEFTIDLVFRIPNEAAWLVYDTT